MSDKDLKAEIEKLTEEEQEVSYRRRLLHGRDRHAADELVARLHNEQEQGKSPLEEVDLDRLAQILAGKASPPSEESA